MDSRHLPTDWKIAHAWIKRHAHILMIVATIGFVLLFSLLGILNHRGLRTQLNDLGHVEQALWSATQGHPSMPVSDPAFESRFVTHSNFILYALVPLYAFLPFSETLLILSAVMGGLAGYFLFRLVRLVLKDQSIALLFGVALLLNPYVQSLVLYDFHVDVMALPLAVLLLICIEKKHALGFWISLGLLMTVKEDMPLFVMFLSPFIWRRWSFEKGASAALVALIYWMIITNSTQLLFGTTVGTHNVLRFAEFGATPSDAVLYLLTHPWIAVIKVLTIKKIMYLIVLMIEGGLLAIFSPLLALAAIPNIAQNVLDTTDFQDKITFVYYSGLVITILYAAAAYSLKNLSGRFGPFIRAGLLFFPIQAIVMTYMLSPAPYGSHMDWKDYSAVTDPAAVEKILAEIPSDAAIYSQNNLAVHLDKRPIIVKKIAFIHLVDYAVFSVRIPHVRTVPLFYANTNMRLATSPTTLVKNVQMFFDNPDFGILDYDADASLYLFKRGQPHTLNDAAYDAFQKTVPTLYFRKDGTNASLTE